MADETPDRKEADRIAFHFVKSAAFRVIHVDGAHGGVNPDGYVQMTLYSQRNPIPQRTVHTISHDRLGDEIREERLIRDGPVRECEVTAIMDIGTASALRDWLGKQLETVEALKKGVKPNES